MVLTFLARPVGAPVHAGDACGSKSRSSCPTQPVNGVQGNSARRGCEQEFGVLGAPAAVAWFARIVLSATDRRHRSVVKGVWGTTKPHLV
ncbi:hypothetical protein ACFWGN_15865 [Oerskovia sp. NPDC060338]|uniref:hypothetical protein n=1 Tax=Oerskovia sp. NPDC060338 TaxID=3347100 RepID=UPI00365B3052